MKKSLLSMIAFGCLTVASLFAVSSAFAGSNIWTPQATCTTNNCQSLKLGGTIMSFGSEDAASWTANLFAAQGECLRLDVTTADDDLEIVVVAPNGYVYRNDDRSSSNNLPLVRISSAPISGYYTVHVSTWDGYPVDVDFILKYGRYNSGNPNCNGAIAPMSSDDDGGKRNSRIIAPGTAPRSLK
ncbi:MAG: hypothetical protein HGA78_02830 [Nitrospirales bacterium]|nr:hypothetical protein [Nitrospirales bacterium]